MKNSKKQKVSFELKLIKNDIFVSADSLFKIAENNPNVDIIATLKLNLLQYQNYIEGLPTHDEYNCRIHNKDEQ